MHAMYYAMITMIDAVNVMIWVTLVSYYMLMCLSHLSPTSYRPREETPVSSRAFEW